MKRLETHVGAVELRSCVLTAAGTAGYGAELADYGDLSQLGAVVTKSLAAFAWNGNAAPRVASHGAEMLNSVGLAGPGVTTWRQESLPELRRTGATVVASIWGRSVAEFADAARDLRGADVVAVEINASCPNLEGRTGMFAHSAELTAELVRATKDLGLPRWVKLSPNTPDLVAIASEAVAAGAEALVLTNTLLGMTIDTETGRASLGNGGGGLSGPGLFPLALRAVYEVCAALPDIPVVGVGGVRSGDDAIQMLMAGARAVEIGTATFADPKAPWRIAREMSRWLARRGIDSIEEVIGAAHG